MKYAPDVGRVFGGHCDSTTKQVIIATSEASNLTLTVSGVLSHINELVKDNDGPINNSTALNT